MRVLQNGSGLGFADAVEAGKWDIEEVEVVKSAKSAIPVTEHSSIRIP
jgi:hypothetical protein